MVTTRTGIEGGVPGVELVTDAGRLAALEDDWGRLARTATLPTASHEWAMAGARALGPGERLHVLVVERRGQVVAAAPLAQGVDGRLRWLGACMHEPSDLLWADPAGLRAVAEALLAQRAPVLLQRVPEWSPTPAALRAARTGAVLQREADSARSPAITLDERWRSPERQLSARRRGDLRRASRRAEALGEVTFRMRRPAMREVDAAITEVLRVEAAGWKGRAGTAMAHDGQVRELVADFSRRMAARGALRLGALHIGGRLAAVQLGVVWANRFWLVKVGFDEEFARCSPGVLLLARSLAHAAEQGLSSFEFLGRDEPWIRAWTDESYATSTVALYPFGPRGLRIMAADAAQLLAARAGGAAARGQG